GRQGASRRRHARAARSGVRKPRDRAEERGARHSECRPSELLRDRHGRVLGCARGNRRAARIVAREARRHLARHLASFAAGSARRDRSDGRRIRLMQYEILGEAAQVARLTLSEGESCWASKGGIMSYTEGIDWRLRVPGGVAGAARRVVSGEGVALGYIQSLRSGASVSL